MGEVGSRKTRIDGNGDVTTYTYDAVNRNTLVDYPAGTDTTFTYDALGRRTVMEDGVGLTSWVYNAIGRLTEVDEPYGSVVTYSYDVRSRKSSMGLSGVGLTTYSYDSRGRLRLIDNPYAETTTYSYDALSRASRQDNDNGAYTTWAYNNAGWVTGVTNKKSDASVISSFAYNYDNVGNRTRMTEANGDYTSFVYDSVYQLTDERKRTSGDEDIYRVTYVYDAVGNRTDMTKNATRTTYSYDAANKMTEFTEGGSRTTFSYDANGNQTAKTVPGGNITTYSYNYENKLTKITYPDASLNTFTYDGDGKRLQKQDSVGTLRFVYDHQGPTGLYDLAKETDGSNNLVAFYTQGPLLLAMRRGGNSYFYHDDALGSVVNTTNSSETVTSTYKYYAFGEVLSSSGTLTNPFKYVGGLGYYFDPDSGLLLLRARYYWPGVGRFVSRDPVSEGANWYQYVGGRAVSLSDPGGLAYIDIHSSCACFCKDRPLAVQTAVASAEKTQYLACMDFGYHFWTFGWLGNISLDIRECRYRSRMLNVALFCEKGRRDVCGFTDWPWGIHITDLACEEGPCGPLAATILHEWIHSRQVLTPWRYAARLRVYTTVRPYVSAKDWVGEWDVKHAEVTCYGYNPYHLLDPWVLGH